MFFQDHFADLTPFDRVESIDGDHGRIETRRYFATSDISWLQGKEYWTGLKSVIMVQRQRDIDDNVSSETSYYLSSIKNDVEKIAGAIRAHWHKDDCWIHKRNFAHVYPGPFFHDR